MSLISGQIDGNRASNICSKQSLLSMNSDEEDIPQLAEAIKLDAHIDASDASIWDCRGLQFLLYYIFLFHCDII